MDNTLIKNEVSEIIEETIRGVSKYQNSIKDRKGKLLPDINKLKVMLTDIIHQLDGIKKFVDDLNHLSNEFDTYLADQKDGLLSRDYLLLKEMRDQFLNILKSNLPDKMDIDQVDNLDEWQVIIQEEKPYKDGKYIRESYEKRIIGDMKLFEIENQFVIKIRIKENEYHDYTIDNAYKVYPVINHIITKYNYKDVVN